MPGWIPTPVEGLLNRPVMKFILALSGSMGARLLPSSMSLPSPRAHQWLPLIPLPMKSTAKRLGKGEALGARSAAHTGTDSSQGRAMATPAPRSRVRRERRSAAPGG